MTTTSTQESERDRLRQFIRLAGGIAMMIGIVVLFGRLVGIPMIASVLDGYIPMAVATAIMSAGYGLILVSGAYSHKKKIVRTTALILISFFTVYALMKFLEYFLDTDLTLDSIMFPVKEKLGNFPVNRSSPITGLLFFLCGIAMFIRIFGREGMLSLNLVGGIGAFIAFSGFAGIIGYLLGTPLLYGGDIIPLSLLTTIVFLFLGCALLAMSGSNSIFLRRFSGPSPSARVLRVILPIIILALLADNLLEAALSEVYSINPALIPSVMLLILIALAVLVVIRSSSRIFRKAEKAEEERLLAIEKLNKQYEFLQSIIESLPHPFYVINPDDYSVVMGNSASGWDGSKSRSTCYGLTHGMDLPCSSDEHHTCPIEEIRRTRQPGVVEHVHQDREGNLRNAEVHAFPILDHEGNLSQVIEYSLDITERKNKERSLKESEERFRTLTETSTDAIVSIDSQGRILFFNAAAERIFEYSASEVHLRTIDLLIPDRYGKIFMDGISRYLETGVSTILGEIFEFRGRRKQGEIFPIELSLSELKVGDQINFIGIVRDISDRKKIEDDLKRFTQELKDSNDTKDKFFSIIAHDLKSPFNAILGLTNVLIQDFHHMEEKRIEALLNTIKTSSGRAFELLENLLAWANSQTGQIEFRPEPVLLGELVDEVAQYLNGPAANKGIRILNTIQEDCTAIVDKQMILTVLRNLISNAVKFTPFGGEVTISTESGLNQCTLSVRDTGVGIAKRDIETLFRIDSKHSTRGTADEKGTGLGLILCKEFVEKHGGKIWAESEEGVGSIFIFSLPVG